VFTGLIQARTVVRRAEARGSGLRLVLAAPPGGIAAPRGASIAVSGVCLTLAGRERPGSAGEAGGEASFEDNFEDSAADLAFDLSAETLARTWLGRAAPGRVVNLERALRFSDRLDGHLVAGHVDGLGRLLAVEDAGDGGRRVRCEVAPELAVYLVPKGSITLDGISLTVVDPDGPRFDVAVVPETLARTSLGLARAGDEVHVEGDLVGKWVLRGLAAGLRTR
jgi:riboflavin synthase